MHGWWRIGGARSSGRRPPRGRPLAGERGSFAVELAVLAPILLTFVLVIVDGGRLTWARSRVQGAARDAARAVTINHNSGQAAFDSAYQAVLGSLAGSGANCIDPALELNPDPRAAPIGNGSTVTATVTCQVRFVLFGTEAVSRSQQSVVDQYRQVTTGPGTVP